MTALEAWPAWPIPPRPLDTRPRTDRQRRLLDALEALVLAEGFAHLPMTALARKAGVSPTTLYALAARKDDLVLLVIDRWYQRAGRAAMSALDSLTSPVARIEAWLAGAVHGSADVTSRFLDDVAGHTAVRLLVDKYHQYYAAVLEHLIDEGIAAGDLAGGPTGPSAKLTVQIVDAALVRFQDNHVLQLTGATEAQAAEALRRLVMDGLRPRTDHR